MPQPRGRRFLQLTGPSNRPRRVLDAISHPGIDHRGPEFAALLEHLLAALGPLFGTHGPVVMFPASGTGGWEAAIVNTLAAEDEVLAFDTGHFASLWANLGRRLGLRVEALSGSWRHGPDPEAL